MDRRELLKSAGALAVMGSPLFGCLDAFGKPAGLLHVGQPQAFDYAWLKGKARAAAEQRHQEQTHTIPPEVERLDWDQYQAIRFRADHAIWARERTRFQLRFFHLGLFFRKPVRMHDAAYALIILQVALAIMNIRGAYKNEPG